MNTPPDPTSVNPGTIGSIVIFLLFLAVAIVIRSGYKRLRNMARRREEEK